MSEISVREQKNDQYWYEKEINYGKLSERWKSTGKKQLKSSLETLSIDDLKYIHQKLQLTPLAITDNEHYIVSIIESENALQLFLLYEFFGKFQKSVLDYTNNNGVAGICTAQNPFINLFSLFLESSKDHLLNIFIYYNWNAASTGTIYKTGMVYQETLRKSFQKKPLPLLKNSR